MNMLYSASSMVIGKRLKIKVRTSIPVRTEVPKSPCTAKLAQRQYCTGTG